MRDAEFYALSNAHNKTARLLDEYIMSTDYPLQEARIYVKSIVEMFSYIPFFTIFFRHFMLKKAIEKKREIERRNGIQRAKIEKTGKEMANCIPTAFPSVKVV